MDYIIFGIGSGATLVLAGWLLRDWGPRLRDRKPAEDELLSASDLVLRMAWARFCATCGMAILICGILVMLVTVGAAYLAPSDRAAAIAVIAAFGLAVLLMLLWTGLYLRQFGAFGILRPREKPAPAEPAPAPVELSTTPPALDDGAAVRTPAPSFAETTAARGGLGRFAAFFRKEPAPAAEPPPEAGPDAVADANTASIPAEPSPTEAVIAEISGKTDAGDEKVLAPDDPLVTAVRDTPAEDVAAETGADLPEMAAPAVDSADEPEGPAGSEGDAALTGLSDQELALAQLRRRRMSRLTHPPEPN